jgi:hypothetical protein
MFVSEICKAVTHLPSKSYPYSVTGSEDYWGCKTDYLPGMDNCAFLALVVCKQMWFDK